MSLDKIRKSVDSVLKYIDDGEKVALPLFAAKLAKASDEYPEDHTIGMMAGVVARMASSKKLFISRAEIKDLYNKLYSRNTKFASLFSAELGEIVKQASPTIYNREGDDESFTLLNKAYDKIVDPVLANALNGAFGNKVAKYTDVVAEKAKDVCSRELASFNLKASVEVVNGRMDVVICRASFETPKGVTSIFVPIEIVADRALIPSVFVGNSGSEDLTRENVESYIHSNAGKKLVMNDSIVLSAVTTVKENALAKLSDVDLAVTKMNAEKESKADFSQGQVLFQHIDPEAKNLEVFVPKISDPEMDSFAKKFESPLGLANFKFTSEKVKLGKDIISRHLQNFGLTNHQISVCDSNDSTIFYAIALNNGRVAFRVPVKVENGKLLAPTLLISSGSVESFSQIGVSKVIDSNRLDYKTAAVASSLYGMKDSELVDVVRTCVNNQEYAKAEETLNVLSQSGDDKAYQTAFSVYTNGLNGVKQASTVCSRVVKNAHSSHELCGHTGLPLHKVYQDKNGDCHPLYRKGMSETSEGAYFMNSKIFF